MQSLSDPTKYSFTTNQLPIAVKSLIGAAFPVLQAQLADPSIMIPMRWIRGDTAPHADQNPVDITFPVIQAACKLVPVVVRVMALFLP